MTPTTADVTTAFLEGLGAQDPERMGELFAEEIDWFVPGDPAVAQWVGARSRKSEVPDYFRALWAALEPGKSIVSVEAVVTDGEDAVIFGAFDHVAAPTGRPFHTAVALRLTVKAGKITRMHLFEDTAATAAAFAA
ncbi:nuclear transport factor 2 family protein [Prescottella equi]|jgi:ketosteroid isomerase-like protein|uniref:nuclear transport factor 2 family protein n=1 Tax=Rhodococcus hoagii TaxID=43767 RepID=UPI0002D59F33|nr:nuclear transport factor 2 family protein [Prescottella equi]AVP70682.1 ketosteroid isomerase [Prescottella equi]MBM4694003.1 nuclear transport factor 2 family protein [Prescottella equi]MBM4733392.1 nuclear transport factor 2 family protein [Prescottella equi]NKZ65286.1 nuclear transport factor 2 family protein [Prescottella equi]NKZ76748.1 nuclear transport factor 2 family protein [Prescottella equi]